MNDNMSAFWIGVLSGFFASAVFFVLIRMLPAKWVRYQISFGELYRELGIGPHQWLLTVRLNAPRWKRIVMDPLRESLLVQVRQGKMGWLLLNLMGVAVYAGGLSAGLESATLAAGPPTLIAGLLMLCLKNKKELVAC